MLISEDDADRKNRAAEEQPQPAAQPPAPPAPPSYQASTQPQPQPTPSTSQTQPILPIHNPVLQHTYGSVPDSVRDAKRKSTRRARKRFCKALLVGLLVWSLFSIFIRTFVGMVKSGNTPYGDHDQGHGNLPALIPLPSDVHRGRCIKAIDIKATDIHNELKATFGVSLRDDYESLVLLSRGYLSRGYTTITQAESNSGNNDATVDIKIVYNESHKELLRDLTLCSIDRGDGSGRRGVGVFSPTQWPHNVPHLDLLPTIFITLHLPANQVFIKKLETDLPNFSQFFLLPPATEEKEMVKFGDLSISSTNGAIGGEAVHFLEGTISTTNAIVGINNVECNGCVVKSTNEGIHGTYRARRSLSIATTNAPVDVHVFLGDEEAERVYGFAEIQTTNQELDTEITLLGKESASATSVYNLVTFTTNARLNVTIPAIPLYSNLQSTSRTTNGYGSVVTPSQFEGTFLLTTTNGQAEVDVVRNEDPAGKQRDVHWDFEKMAGGVAKGSKRWGGGYGRHGKGNVVLSSTNAPVRLLL